MGSPKFYDTGTGYGIVFDAQFINDCARTQFTYVLMRFSQKRERMSTISKSKRISASSFEDQRLERTDFAVVHASPSIGAGPSIALFRKLYDGESSDKVLSWRAAIKRVTWQLSSKFICSLSVCATRQSSNAILGPVETCKLSFRLYVII